MADFFGDERRIGKTLGTDLLSGKMTLPLFILLERLAPGDRSTLGEEIRGVRSPDLAARLRQMDELDVFGAVAAAIEAELALATEALAPWPGLSPTPLLMGLAGVLRAQVAGLR